jgi:hypothetical protein
MDFLDAYSYGYDQVTVNPLRSVNYDDSEYKLFQKKSQDTRAGGWLSSAQPEHKNPYADRGFDQRREMQRVRTNLEDVVDPLGARPQKNQIADQIGIPSRGAEDIMALERELASAKLNRPCTCGCAKKDSDQFNISYLLLVIVIAMTAICLFQHSNSYAMTNTLLDMIKQHRGARRRPESRWSLVEE